MRPHLLLVILALTLGAAGCPRNTSTDEATAADVRARARAQKLLGEATQVYYKHLQWERWQKASEFIPAGEPRNRFIREMQTHPIKVTDFTILSVKMDEDRDDLATVVVAMKIVRQSDLVQEDKEHTHVWVRKGAKWFVLFPYVDTPPASLTDAE